MPDTPLNPDALANLRLLADEGTRELRHVVLEPDLLHKLLDIAESASQPEVNSDKASAWEEGFQAGWEEHENPGAFVNDYWDAKTPNPYKEEQ